MTELRNAVAEALHQLVEQAPSPFWHGVFSELHKRWTHRETLEPGDEITIYINCPDADIQAKVMERAQQFAPMLEFADANAHTRLVIQRYNSRGAPKVILRLRLLPNAVKRRAKFVANPDEI
jgi:hypothetical protein